MSKKGGYKIVSLGGLDLTGENLALSGLYDALKLSYGKPILLTGIVIDGEKKKDALVQAEEGENKINIKNLYGYDLEVAKSGDAITVTESSDGIELPIPEMADVGKIVGVNNQGKYALQDSVKKQVEDGAEAGTIQDALGLDSNGKLVKGSANRKLDFIINSNELDETSTVTDLFNKLGIGTVFPEFTTSRYIGCIIGDDYHNLCGIVDISVAYYGNITIDICVVNKSGMIQYRGYLVTLLNDLTTQANRPFLADVKNLENAKTYIAKFHQGQIQWIEEVAQ